MMLSYVGYLVRGLIRNSKLRSGCRRNVYTLAEKNSGKIRYGVDEDGIGYKDKSKDLSFHIVFEEKFQAEQFESAIRRIPNLYRKRKPIDMIALSNDIEVEVEPLMRVVLNDDQELVRVFDEQYGPLEDESDCSPQDSLEYASMTSCADMNDETRARLVDREDSDLLYRQKPEKCHILSQKYFPEYKNDANNILFMSRHLHQHFDAIDSTEGIPMFYFQYVGHDRKGIAGYVHNKPTPLYETQVKVVFKDESIKAVLSPYMKSFTSLSNTVIQISLMFPNPDSFRGYASKRGEDTLRRWASYDGVAS